MLGVAKRRGNPTEGRYSVRLWTRATFSATSRWACRGGRIGGHKPGDRVVIPFNSSSGRCFMSVSLDRPFIVSGRPGIKNSSRKFASCAGSGTRWRRGSCSREFVIRRAGGSRTGRGGDVRDKWTKHRCGRPRPRLGKVVEQVESQANEGFEQRFGREKRCSAELERAGNGRPERKRDQCELA